ncbi:MAG: helix-turn-helix domain-containing protein [Candidatus Omnitrophica bacterium]|nr:helix-turn-helix domain-containing protein [Candidatus Omnitrophota bacterium]
MKKSAYLSIQEVAERFGVNITTVYRLVKRGKLPAFKIGNQWRFSESQLEEWVADQVTVKWLLADEAPSLGGTGGRKKE